MSHVIVKRIGPDGAGTEDAHVMTLRAFSFHGLGALPNLDELDSLKGVDPAVKARVLEALHEILRSQHAVRLHLESGQNAGAGDGQATEAHRAATPAKAELH